MILSAASMRSNETNINSMPANIAKNTAKDVFNFFIWLINNETSASLGRVDTMSMSAPNSIY